MRHRAGCVTRAVFVLVSLLLFGACGANTIQPLQFGEAVWQPGETSLYQVTDMYGDYAGTVRWTFSQPEADVWRLERFTDTQGDEELLTMDMAVQGLRPQASSLQRHNADGVESARATYDRGEVNLELTTRQDITTYERVNVPSDSRDARALYMLIRSLPLAEGYGANVNTFLPVASRMARAEISVKGEEEVTTPAGTFKTWRVTLDEGDRSSTAWVAMDAPYPLVKYVDAGNGGVFELSEFVASP